MVQRARGDGERKRGGENYLRPHQKKERLPERAHRSAPRPERHPEPGDGDPYWGWHTIPGGESGHSLAWRPRAEGVKGSPESMTTIWFGPRGTTKYVSILEAAVRASEMKKTERRANRECFRESGAALDGVEAAREVNGYSPPRMEVRCTKCGAGIIFLTPTHDRMGNGMKEAIGILMSHWGGEGCRAVRETLTARVVMET